MKTKQKHAKNNYKTIDYGFQKELDFPFHEAVERTRAALADEGFGVLCEIDIKEKLREKLNVHFQNYVILGACNPALAFEALQEESDLGLLLPCNVIVYESEASTIVAAIDAAKMMSVVGNHKLNITAKKVNEKLQRALENI
jgi:uncharacterized protein (DUF302 family)